MQVLHRIAKPQFTTQHRNLRHLSQALGKATQSKRDKPIQAEETRTPRDTPESVRILKQPATCIGEDRLDLCALNCPTLQLRCCCTSGLSNALEFFQIQKLNSKAFSEDLQRYHMGISAKRLPQLGRCRNL